MTIREHWLALRERKQRPIESDVRWVISVLMWMWPGMLFAAIDGSVLTTLQSQVASDLNAADSIVWIGASYFLTQAIFLPLTARITNRVGRDVGLTSCMILFAIGNTVSGISYRLKSPGVMIAGRLISGMGGGGQSAIPGFVISDDHRRKRRMVLWGGLNTAIFSGGTAVGGVFGGAIQEALHWEWAFFIQAIAVLPFAIIVLLLVPEGPEKRMVKEKKWWQEFDWPGAILLGAAIGTLIAGLNELTSNQSGAFHVSIGLLVASGVLFVMLPFVEAWFGADQAILPRVLFFERKIERAAFQGNETAGMWGRRLAAFGTSFFANIAWMMANYYVPVYFEAQGLKPFDAGKWLLPAALTNAVGAFMVQFISRFTDKLGPDNSPKLTRIGLIYCAILVAFTGSLIAADLPWPKYRVSILYAMLYFGFAGCSGILNSFITKSVHSGLGAVAQAANYAFRSTGQAVGSAVGTVIYQQQIGTRDTLISSDAGLNQKGLTGVFRVATGIVAPAFAGFVIMWYCDYFTQRTNPRDPRNVNVRDSRPSTVPLGGLRPSSRRSYRRPGSTESIRGRGSTDPARGDRSSRTPSIMPVTIPDVVAQGGGNSRHLLPIPA